MKFKITTSEDAGDEGLYHILDKLAGSTFMFKLRDGTKREGLLVSTQYNDPPEYDDQEGQTLRLSITWWSDTKGDYYELDAAEEIEVSKIKEMRYL